MPLLVAKYIFIIELVYFFFKKVLRIVFFIILHHFNFAENFFGFADGMTVCNGLQLWEKGYFSFAYCCFSCACFRSRFLFLSHQLIIRTVLAGIAFIMVPLF